LVAIEGGFRETENIEIQSTDNDSTVTDDLEDMIEQLPENFPQALPIIQNEIAPIISECDPGLKDHYISLIKKRTKAASKRAVQLEIENAVKQLNEEDLSPAKEPDTRIIDPEIKEMADQIASDPLLFKKPYRDGQHNGRYRRGGKSFIWKRMVGAGMSGIQSRCWRMRWLFEIWQTVLDTGHL
jgi:hypothetical protein